jgi:gliding motility-associated-like protein
MVFTITIHPIPTVSPIADQSWCAGATVPPVTLSGPVAGSTFSWTNNNTLIGLGASGSGDVPSYTATNGTPGPLSGVVSVVPTANGCSGPTRSFTVTVNPVPVVAPLADQVLCHDQQTVPVLLQTPVGGASFSWTNSDPSIGLAANGATANLPSFRAVNPGTVPVVATVTVQATAYGCPGPPRSFTITVNPLPSGSISSSVPFICEGGSQTLTVTGGSSYQWYLDGVAIAGATGPSYAATQAGGYTADIRNVYGCTATASNSVSLVLRRKPQAAFTYDRYCVGLPVSFRNGSEVLDAGSVRYDWDFGVSGATSVQPNPTFTYIRAGDYTVSLTVTPQDCPALASRATAVLPVRDPPPGIRYTSLNVLKNKDQLLQARVFPGATYNWVPSSGLSDPSARTPYFRYDRETEYRIGIRTVEGCRLTDTLLVRVFEEPGIFVATAFTPNGDGRNDLLYPRLVAIRKLRYFRVFDRWGQLMYETSTEGAGWDGKFKGVNQPMDTYAWVAEGEDTEGRVLKRAGVTSLLR